MSAKGAVIIGVGPGIGASLARQLAESGHVVGMIGLEESVLTEIVAEVEGLGSNGFGVVADVADMAALGAAVAELAHRVGRVDLLHFNPSFWREAGPLELTPAELAQDVTFGAGGLLVALQAARPAMSAGSRITATGSMAADVPGTVATSLGVQKAALRNLVHSIDATLKPDGIRAVSVTVRGSLRSSAPFMPDAVAAAILAAARQDDEQWRSELGHPADA